MDPQHSPAHAAVFVDHTGRRRRDLTVAAVLGTVLVLAMAAILVGGAFSHTSLDVVGWPGGGPAERAEPAGTPSTRSATPTRTRTPTPTPTPTPAQT
ncbi:MAG: hypothetical protein HOY71_18495, partial [Nonomuraea sp.]|nr:hypothetical protein [Nonomuraea sp.]